MSDIVRSHIFSPSRNIMSASYITCDESTATTVSSESTFFSTRPTFFHIYVAVSLLDCTTGTLAVVDQPRAPNGVQCVMECGQQVVIFPDFTTVWHIEYFNEDDDTVTYTAFNESGNNYINFVIKNDWSSVKVLFLFKLC